MDESTYVSIRERAVYDRQKSTLTPFKGWALDALGELDRVSPGLLLHAFGASPKWRQSVFLAIGTGVLLNPDVFLTRANGERPDECCWKKVQRDLAESLIAMTPRRIVEAALGDVPDGLGGSLAKLGGQPMRHSEDYITLVELLSSAESGMKLRAKTLLQLNRLDADLLAAVLQLDEIALIPGVLCRVGDKLEAVRLNRRIAAIRLVASGASFDALRHSLNSQPFRGHNFASSWVSKADRPPVVHEPLDLHPDFERITPASAEAVGREFSNCLKHKTGQLVSGVWGAWVWRPGSLIATVTSCVEGPLLTGVYGHANREAPPEHTDELKKVLQDLGVHCFTRKEVPDELRILTMGEFSQCVVDEEFE